MICDCKILVAIDGKKLHVSGSIRQHGLILAELLPVSVPSIYSGVRPRRRIDAVVGNSQVKLQQQRLSGCSIQAFFSYVLY